MTKTATDQKKTRTQYSQSYKDDALALAERIGFAKALLSSAFRSLRFTIGKINFASNKLPANENNS